ncbi:MAG: MFS transporter [Coriobacteriia bacterium]
MSHRRGRVPRNVAALGIVSLLTDASSEMVYPILPFFLSTALGAPVAVVGLIESVAEATASLTRVGSGWLSDRLGKRRPLVLAGYSLSDLAKPLLAFAPSWPAVLALRFVDRFGKGIRTAPRDALIADSSTEADRGLNFGVHRALDTVGAAIGPLVAFLVLSRAANAYRTVFLISAVPGVLAVVLLSRLVREVPASQSSAGAGRAVPPSLRGLGRPFIVFTTMSAVFALGNTSDAFLVLRARDLGAPEALVALMYALFNVVGALVAVPAGMRSDRVGRRKVVAAGFALYALVYAGFAAGGPSWSPWVLFAAYGVPYGMTEGLTRAFVVDLVGEDRRATAIGGYTFVLGLVALPASAFGGLLWDLVSPSAPFWFSSALMGVAAVGVASARSLSASGGMRSSGAESGR